MAAYKDENGTWYSTFYIKDWQGKRIRKKKRGFKTKKEALQWEASFISQEDGSMKMASVNEFERMRQSFMVYYNYWNQK